jgi:hypothetical protein
MRGTSSSIVSARLRSATDLVSDRFREEVFGVGCAGSGTQWRYSVLAKVDM